MFFLNLFFFFFFIKNKKNVKIQKQEKENKKPKVPQIFFCDLFLEMQNYDNWMVSQTIRIVFVSKPKKKIKEKILNLFLNL